MRAAVAALECALRSRGYGFMRVSQPHQRLDGGVVVLKIAPIAVSAVNVRGARYWKQAPIAAALPALRPSVTPNTLAVANRNPARQMRIHFAAGEAPATVAANVEVNYRDPLSLFAWVNNTGTEETGDSRVGAGLQHANLFGRDHLHTATYTTSAEELDSVSQFGVHYQVPLAQLPEDLRGLPGPRPDSVPADMQALFGAEPLGEILAGLYVHVQGGDVVLLRDGRALGLGPGETGHGDGARERRLVQAPRFMTEDIFPRPGEVDPKLLELFGLLGQDGKSGLEQCELR